MAATTYIALDVGFTFTSALGPSNPPEALHSIPLFVFTSIWPGAAALIYLATMTYIVLAVLNEFRPMWFYLLAAVLFVLSQLDWFLLSNVICRVRFLLLVYVLCLTSVLQGASQKVDGSFIATLLETASVGVLYLAWRSITEGALTIDFHLLFRAGYNRINADPLGVESWDEDAYYN